LVNAERKHRVPLNIFIFSVEVYMGLKRSINSTLSIPPLRHPFLLAVSICLKIILAHVPISGVPSHTLDTAICEILTRVKKLTGRFALEFRLNLLPGILGLLLLCCVHAVSKGRK